MSSPFTDLIESVTLVENGNFEETITFWLGSDL